MYNIKDSIIFIFDVVVQKNLGGNNMIKTNERRIVLEIERGSARVNNNDTSEKIITISEKYNYNVEVKGTKEYIEKYFPVVKASELSVHDYFLKHEPQSNNQRKFKETLIKVINSGLSDFRAQCMDAALDENDSIYYKSGRMPAVGKSPNWWYKKAKEFLPKKQSRLGTSQERIAFLGVIIKYLIIEKEYTVSDAWRVVCDQSKELGYYADSQKSNHMFDDTGSRQIGNWYDLANTSKITVDYSTYRYLFIGGNYLTYGSDFPLAYISTICIPDNDCYDSTGWIVLSV